ncbi:hypothetical protein [Pseudoxanthomonas mexicana]|uniref:hypothetical protein n=1 Tax=Pseudoxanthomonas mexicana TaxID=128785 RepID=UPI001FD6AF47|nr:hypothetical protein [Pseudoxanthomonas mexicana]UOV02812.1 hypothetical protein MUU73_06125 [Pseudoxanthomonas mexicana]
MRLLKKDDAVNELLNSCNRVGEAYLFGGLVRDALLGSAGVFGDVDIFVSGPLDADFVESISRVHRRTNFGGMRLVVGRYDVDIWELSKSHAFRFERGSQRNIGGLLSTVCFSTDAVAVSLVSGKILADRRFNETMKSRIFGFVSKPNLLEVLQVVRVARIFVKNGVRPGLDVSKYFVDGVNEFGVDQLISAEKKWKGRRLLDKRTVQVVDEYCRGSLSSGFVLDEPWFGDGVLFPSESG